MDLESQGDASSGASVRLVGSSPAPVALAALVDEQGPRMGSDAPRMGAATPSGVQIMQPQAQFVLEPYLVAAGRPERKPALGVLSRTNAKVKNWSKTDGVEYATAIDISLNRGTYRRWIADPDRYVDGVWSPSVASAGLPVRTWKANTNGTQYIDPSYDYVSRRMTLQRNAMIFAGGAWFTASGKMSGGTEWSIALVAMFHANTDSTRATILNSFQDDPNDPDNFQTDTGLQDICIDIFGGDKLSLRTGGRQTYDHIATISERPVVVIASGNATISRLLVLDNRRAVQHHFKHPDVGPADMRFLLGRPNVMISGRRGTARMDLFEVTTYDKYMKPGEMHAIANRLDGVYGATG